MAQKLSLGARVGEAISAAGRSAEKAAKYAARSLRDRAQNRRCRGTGERIVVARHPFHYANSYRQFLDWLEERDPGLRAGIELRSLPCRLRDWSRVRVLWSWLSDTRLSPGNWEYRALSRLESEAERRGVAVLNRASAAAGASKAGGARAIAGAGLRTPRVEVIDDVERFRAEADGLDYPLLVREDRVHAGTQPILFVETPEQARAAPLERMKNPIAVEFIDVRGADGLYRRYRYLVAGDAGLPANLHVSRCWEVRGKRRVTNSATAEEEIAYISRPEPLHEQFVAARRALGIDLAALDYSFDRQGNPVVWEANVMPGIHYSNVPGRDYARETVHYCFGLMARLCLTRGGLALPGWLEELLGASPATFGEGREAA